MCGRLVVDFHHHWSLVAGSIHARSDHSTKHLSFPSHFNTTQTYSHYIDWDGMSIWIQQTDGEAYIFYFEESLGNEYEAWGLYKCDLASYYMDQADESSDKSPATKEGCQGDPVVFCPALDDDDANSLGDGQSPSDGTLDYDASAVPHFVRL